MSTQDTPFPDEIRLKYPQLSKHESLICFLMWLGYNQREIAEYLAEKQVKRISRKIKNIQGKMSETPS